MATKNGTSGYSAEQAAKYCTANRDFPLRWHPRGGWRKKIRGKDYYFGRVPPADALAKYEHERTWLEGGEVPPAYDPDAITLLELCNEFCAEKKLLVASGEVKQRTWDDYHRVYESIMRHFGASRIVANLRPADFAPYRAKLGANCVAASPRLPTKPATRRRSIWLWGISVTRVCTTSTFSTSATSVRGLRQSLADWRHGGATELGNHVLPT